MIQLYLHLAALFSVFAAGSSVTLQTDFEALVAAEKAFALQVETNGIRQAFLDNLDEQSVVFLNNQFVAGRSAYARQPDGPGLLSWRPVYAEISASGEFGFTTGPYEVRRQRTGEPITYGMYTSVWQKTGEGHWKVLIDFGCTGKPYQPELPFQMPQWFGPKSTRAVDTSQANRELMQVETAFARAALERGHRYAYKRVLPVHDSIRLLRDGDFPRVGLAARKIAATLTQKVAYKPLRTVVSQAGDLGYAYGYTGIREKHQAYLHIWRKRKGTWQLAHEVLARAR